MPNKTAGAERRERLRNEFWPDEDAWTGEGEKGWFRAPRTLPLILELLASKGLSGNRDLSGVYLELLARHIDSGLVEMTHEGDHAFAAGYTSNRAIRTWQERLNLLEKNGFIKSKQTGNQRHRYVMIVHPTVPIQKLRDAGKVPDQWWDAYRARQIETKEASYVERQAIRTGKVVKIATAKTVSSVGKKVRQRS